MIKKHEFRRLNVEGLRVAYESKFIDGGKLYIVFQLRDRKLTATYLAKGSVFDLDLVSSFENRVTVNELEGRIKYLAGDLKLVE